jgi:hypothetical protein
LLALSNIALTTIFLKRIFNTNFDNNFVNIK